jgi:diguanylate cyclase (GGDEF)-like protein
VALLSDIRQLKAQQRELERLALHDSLTGLPNRILLGQALERGLTAVSRDGTAIAICYVDLDGFKEINDRHGHSAGDAVLQAMAQRMQALLPAGDLVARLGCDEFVAILHNLQPGATQQGWPWV